ncbi:Hypothetical predicted protein [Mytilus galloprovincialis]|uniref:Reverse transcriptase domain-containing protein n=1 Tax=Mytilus galloprovincialis TaxID=29158 RepID=A0A8B6HD68_MYTGA|nr:Hypothetical predicted protein [Mytilus galloprovincialis]
MPMGCSISCATFEKCSTFLHWSIKNKTRSENLDHYLHDFIFVGEAHKNDCFFLMTAFSNVCSSLEVPIANENTEGPCTKLEYLGLLIDSDEMLVRIPDDKIEKLKDQINWVLEKRKVTLKEMQSLTDNLIADALSRGQMKKFREVTSNADPTPLTIPQEFLDLLM